MSLPARLALLALHLWGCAAQDDDYPWFLIDAASVVCRSSDPPAPGAAELTIDIDALIPAEDKMSPHVFTLYRSTNNSVNVSFFVADAANRVAVKPTTVALQAFARRRLQVQVDDSDAEELRVWLDSLPDEETPRRLAARRRTASTPRRRRTAPTPSTAAPSTRVGDAGGTSASAPRRRAIAGVARRRGSPATGTAQPMTGVDGSRYSNNQGMSYGYTNQNQLNNNYAGGYQSTPYGYSGANAYQRPSGGSGVGKVAAAAAAGVVAGVGASYLYSRWRSYDRCSTDDDDSWFGSCSDCRSLYSGSCQPETPKVANRDDLMSTGFWPDDYKSPLVVKVTGITGADFAPGVICPPAPEWNETIGQDLFLTLTKITELGDTLAPDAGGTTVAGAAVASVRLGRAAGLAAASLLLLSALRA